MRTPYDLTAAQVQRIALSKTVPCRPRDSRRGCGVPAGERCVSLATGRPLGGWGAHVDRLLDAEAAAATSASARRRGRVPAPRPPGPQRELATA